MKPAAHCPQCARALSPTAPLGLCSQCLLQSILEPTPPDDGWMADPGLPGEEKSRTFGDYELLEVIARGGMGVVYRARQLSLHRIVALKMIRAGEFASAAQQQRFRAEAEAAAHLDHPNIVPIYEVGEHEGQACFAMKLIEGGSLAGRMANDEGRMTSETVEHAGRTFDIRHSSSVISKVARAVHYAHQRGVLHRDLKPSNILLDARDEPFVTDFGLAKRLDAQPSTLNLPPTLSGAVIGTPSYMSPEQAAGRPHEITTAADIYSLGAILYELIAGCPPFQAETPLATMRQVMEDEPVPPSRVRGRQREEEERDRSLETSAFCLLHSAFSLPPSAFPDLETICLKCLQKNPAQRYATAEALADDLDRWLRHEPIHARPSTVRERMVKWARRHPARAGLVLLAVLAPAAIIAVLMVSRVNVRRERNEAFRQERLAVNARSVAEMEQRRAEESEQSARAHAYATDIYSAYQALEKDDFAYAFQIVEGYFGNPSGRIPPGDPAWPHLLGFEWRLLWQRTRGEQVCTLTNPVSPALCLAFSPDGQQLLAGGEDGINQWTLPGGKPVGKFSGLNGSVPANSLRSVKSMLFVEKGQRLVVGGDDFVTCWSYPDPVFQFALPERHAEIALSGDEKTLALGQWNNDADRPAKSAHPFSVALYDLETKTVRKVLPGFGHKLALSRDGKWVITGSSSNGVVLWNSESNTLTKIKRDHGSGGMSLSPDGQLLVIGGWQKSINVLEVGSLRLRASFTGYQLGANVLAWLPDGASFLSIGLDQSVKLWQVPPEKNPLAAASLLPDRPDHPPKRTFLGHMAPVSTLAVSRDGKWMASGSLDRTILVWPLESLLPRENPAVLPARVSDRHLEPVSGCIVTYSNQTLVVWNPATAQTPARLLPGTDHMLHAGSLEGGSNFAAFHPGHQKQPPRLEIRRLPDGEILSRQEIPELSRPLESSTDIPMMAALSPDGRWLATTRADRHDLYDLSERRLLPSLQECLHPAHGVVRKILFSPDSQWLVLTQNATDDSSLTIVNVWSGQALPAVQLAREPDSTTCANIDPSSRYLATGGVRQNSIRLWDLRTGRLLGRCNGQATAGDIAWSPDGQTLATHGFLGLKLWSTRFHRELVTLEHRSGFMPCGFTADGRSLVSCSSAGQVRRHTAPTLAEIFATRRQE